MRKPAIHAVEWEDLIANKRPNEGRFYKLDPDVPGRHIVFDLASEKPSARFYSRKQITNRQAYERHKTRVLLGVGFVPMALALGHPVGQPQNPKRGGWPRAGAMGAA